MCLSQKRVSGEEFKGDLVLRHGPLNSVDSFDFVCGCGFSLVVVDLRLTCRSRNLSTHPFLLLVLNV